MKRLMLVAVALSALAIPAGAHASCAGAGQSYSGRVTIGHVTIIGHGVGTLFGASGPVQACSDTGPGVGKARVSVTISVDGVEVCHRTDADGSTFGYDPFVFGGGFHAKGGSCGADVSFDAITGIPDPTTEDVGTFADATYAGYGRTATPSGTYWLEEGKFQNVPDGMTGHWTMGAAVVAAP